MPRFLNKLKKEYYLLIVVFLIGVGIRSLHFSQYLNFSTDQAAFSIRALDIWENKDIELIGPSISMHYIGRDIYQGSITYYVILLFLLATGFDPIRASFLYMVVSMVMVLPLYYGVRLFSNNKSALLVSILYSFLPLYIDYSRFFWNPNFQLSFTPLLLLFMGLYHKKEKLYFLLLVGITSGILLLFHYQYILIILGLLIYYAAVKKLKIVDLFLFIGGVLLGFSPILIFELRNNFYNTQTVLLYLSNLDSVFKGRSSFNVHYILSLSLFAYTILAISIKPLLKFRYLLILLTIMVCLSLFKYISTPSHAFGMASNWNFLYEIQANNIIKQQHISDYNVVHQGYDTVATVQKYLLRKDKVQIDYDDYYNNEYLFIITNRKDYMNDKAYEVSFFQPSQEIESWKISDKYSLYLRKRIKDL